MAQSPFTPKKSAELPPVAGVRLAACEAGIRYSGRKDLMLVLLDAGTCAGGVFTRSKTASAAVDWCRALMPSAAVRALVVNAGNANAFTGMKGREAVEATANAAAKIAECAATEVLIASTGVIGEALDPTKFCHRLTDLAAAATDDAWSDGASAIMTTDTYPKLATRKAEIDGVEIVINGLAKGSGMIAPDMATMLAFFFTDAAIAPEVLQSLCAEAVGPTFNAITIDGDTSTSDTVLLLATGGAAARGAPHISAADDPRLAGFAEALSSVMRDLAHQIVKDGEGASKFVEVVVEGAEHDAAARKIAFAIANSPLVKTALAGEDPNWGRVVMAVGKAGEEANRDKLAIWFGDLAVARDGEVDPDYQENEGARYMKNSELVIRVDVGVAAGQATVWTCDLTHDYISINADYRS